MNQEPEKYTTMSPEKFGMASRFRSTIFVLDIIIGVAVFFGGWAYAISEYGWFLGGTLGWIPSLILAFIAVVLCELFIIPIIGIIVIVVVYVVTQGLI